MARRLEGRCLCGCVEYTVEDAFEYAVNCHCSNCRRATGSALEPLAGIEKTKLTLTRGSGGLLVHGRQQSNHDAHCREFG